MSETTRRTTANMTDTANASGDVVGRSGGVSARLAVVGATGVVGEEILRCLENRRFEPRELGLFASRSGRAMTVFGRDEPVRVTEVSALSGFDVVLLAASSGVSRELARPLADAGVRVVDNSRAFRLENDVPLIVPEINGEVLDDESRIVANPNCSTIVAMMAVGPLHRAFGSRRLIASTYQAVSGAGRAAMNELLERTRAMLDGCETTASLPPDAVFPEGIAFNLVPRVGALEPGGETDEERKMRNESRKILDAPDLEVSCTCVRVAVLRTHTVSCTLELERPASREEVEAVLRSAPGLRFVPSDAERLPTPADVAHDNDVVVCRLRRTFDDGRTWSFVVLGDQLRKGAALNAVQIVERLIRRDDDLLRRPG